MDIAEVWFLAEDAQLWGPYFPGVIRGPSRCPQDTDPEPIGDMEICGQAPVAKRSPLEVVRDQLRVHMEYISGCELIGSWSARPRHKAVVLRFLGIKSLI